MMWIWFLVGITIGDLFGSLVVVVLMLERIDKRHVGELQIYKDGSDGQEYLFCGLSKDLGFVKKQKQVILTVRDNTRE